MAGGVFEETIHLRAGEKRGADYSSPADRLDLPRFTHARTPLRRCRNPVDPAADPVAAPAGDRPGACWRPGSRLGGRPGAGVWPVALADRKPTPAQKEAELKRVNARIEKVRKAVNEDVEKRDKLSRAAPRRRTLGADGRRELDDGAGAAHRRRRRRLRALEHEKAQRERELDGERSALAGELRAAYVNGREEQLKLLLNQEDPAAFGRMLAYYGYFGRARAERIAGHQATSSSTSRCCARRSRRRRAAAGARVQQQERSWPRCKSAQDGRARAVSAIDRQIKTAGRRAAAAAVAVALAREADRRPAQGARGRARADGEAGAIRAAERQAAVARAAGPRAGALRPAARRRLAEMAGHADRHRPRRAGPGAVRRAASSTATGCPAWAS